MKQSQSFSIADRVVIIVLCGGVTIGLLISLLLNIVSVNQSLDQVHLQLQFKMTSELNNVSLKSLSQHGLRADHFDGYSYQIGAEHGISEVTLKVDQSQWQDKKLNNERQPLLLFSRQPNVVTSLDIPSGVSTNPVQTRRLYWYWDLRPLQEKLIQQLVIGISRDLTLVTVLIMLILLSLHRRIIIPVQNFDMHHYIISNQTKDSQTHQSNPVMAYINDSIAAPEELQGVQNTLMTLRNQTNQQQREKQQIQQQLTQVKQELTATVRELEQQLKQLELSNEQLLQSNQFLLNEAQHQQPKQNLKQTQPDTSEVIKTETRTLPESGQRERDVAQLAQLAAGMAHEINNPVAIVYSNIATLKDYIAELITLAEHYQQVEGEISNPMLYEIVQKLRQTMDFDFIQTDSNDLIQSSKESLERVRNIVAELRSFADGDVKQREAVIIDELVQEIINDVNSSPMIQISNVLMTLSPVLIVRDQVKVALQKVLANAIDAMPNGGSIEIAAVEDDDTVSITIKDSGCGMSAEILCHAADPFFTQKEIGQGLGLGLTVATNLISHQGGELLIDSHQGSGTMVTMNFPKNGDLEMGRILEC